jgi:hypothetical protein
MIIMIVAIIGMIIIIMSRVQSRCSCRRYVFMPIVT